MPENKYDNFKCKYRSFFTKKLVNNARNTYDK